MRRFRSPDAYALEEALRLKERHGGDVLKFRGCLEQARKNYHVRLYRDAPHGWLNDTMPGRYRKEAAKDTWALMMTFLKKCFGGGWDKERIFSTFESDYSTHYDFTKNVRME